MNRLISAVAAAVLLTAPVAADEAPGRELVDEFISSISTFRADFRQSLLDEQGNILEETRGSLEISRPGRFRWDNTEPYEQWLIADGLNIWSYDVDLEQVTVKAQAIALANTPALILSGDMSSFEQFRFVESYVEAAHTWVRMEPLKEDAGFTRMELGFVDGTLDRMVFFDTLAQTTLVQFDETEVNTDIDPARFSFSVPDGVDLIGTPAEADAD